MTYLLIDVSSDERSLEIPFLGDTPPTTSITVPGTIALPGASHSRRGFICR